MGWGSRSRCCREAELLHPRNGMHQAVKAVLVSRFKVRFRQGRCLRAPGSRHLCGQLACGENRADWS